MANYAKFRLYSIHDFKSITFSRFDSKSKAANLNVFKLWSLLVQACLWLGPNLNYNYQTAKRVITTWCQSFLKKKIIITKGGCFIYRRIVIISQKSTWLRNKQTVMLKNYSKKRLCWRKIYQHFFSFFYFFQHKIKLDYTEQQCQFRWNLSSQKNVLEDQYESCF